MLHPFLLVYLALQLVMDPRDGDYNVNGGGRRVRTDDIQLAKLALSQLSYTPIISAKLPLPA